MKVLKKSFLISLVFILIVTALCAFSNFLKEDIFDGILVIYISIFVSIFCGLRFSLTKLKLPLGILIVVVSSFSLIHCFDFLFFDYIFFNGKQLNHTVKNLSIFAVFISVLSYLYGVYNKSNKTKNINNLKYPFLQSFIFCLSIIIIYAVIFGFAFSSSFIENAGFFFQVLLAPAIVIYIFSIFLFNYIYKDFERKKWLILFTYLSVFVFYLLSCYMNYFQFKNSINIQNFLTYLFARVPFAYMIILCVQISYLIEINKQEKTILSQKSIESQLNYQQLKNQLSPHFLFNNINVLTSLIEENPKKAISFSENLSDIYRYFLEQEKQDVVLVKDELEFAKNYLELIKSRFEIGFTYKINIDEKVNQRYIVSTILQQVLENVIKHNIINKHSLIEVKISSKENYLFVENNKNLKPENSKSTKKGIKNIKSRITFFTDEKVIIEDNKSHFIIKLPILETI